jgi:predicted nucleotidyltransferase component of viral defense system
MRRPRQIKLDVTFDELLVNKPATLPITRTFSGEPVPPKTVAVYGLEEICAEKLRRLQECTEPRDLYDIWRILSERSAETNLAILLVAM